MGPVRTSADARATPWDPGLLALYRSDYAGLVRLAVLVGADRSVAEEPGQDAFVAAHRTWDGVRARLGRDDLLTIDDGRVLRYFSTSGD